MKNLKVIAFALIISTSSLFASEILPDVPVKQIRTQVVELFETPDFRISEEITVDILFTFSSEGDLIVLKIDSYDPKIIKYVSTHINHKMIDTPGEPNREFTLPLRITKKTNN